MQTINIETPYTFEKQQVTSVTIREFPFEELVSTVFSVRASKPADAPFNGAYNTAVLQARVSVNTADGKTHKLDYVKTLAMPIPVSRMLIPLVNDDLMPLEILSGAEADGLSSPILVKLAHPISGADGKGISELEFMAKTYGDIEFVLGESDELSQTLALLRYVAKPPGMLQMPTWAVSAISASDGMQITRQVLPRFLE